MAGRTTARGYGSHHQALRRAWRPRVDAEQVDCWRCGQRIRYGEPWDLGHVDGDKTRYRGPEHAKCNRATSRHRAERKQSPQPKSTTRW